MRRRKTLKSADKRDKATFLFCSYRAKSQSNPCRHLPGHHHPDHHPRPSTRLSGSPCQGLGSGAGRQTAGQAIRYPDALVTCASLDPRATLVPNVVAVLEVISPTSGSTDRIINVREYAATPFALRHVIAESISVGLTVFDRKPGEATWVATALSTADTLHARAQCRIPNAGIYADLDSTLQQ